MTELPERRALLSFYRWPANNSTRWTSGFLKARRKTRIKSPSLWLSFTHFKEAVHQFLSFLPWSSPRADTNEGRERNLGKTVLLKGSSFMVTFLLKRDSFVYSTNINQFTEKMISSFISSWIKGSFKRPLISHHLIYIWLCVCSCGQRFWQWHKVCFFTRFCDLLNNNHKDFTHIEKLIGK